MNETEKLGLVLMLLYMAKHDHYTKEDMKSWGLFRNLLELVSMLFNLACWVGAWFYLIYPVLSTMFE